MFFKKGEISYSQHSNLWNGHMKRWFFMGKSILLFLQMFPTEPLLPVTQTVGGRRCFGGHPSMALQTDLCQSPGSDKKWGQPTPLAPTLAPPSSFCPRSFDFPYFTYYAGFSDFLEVKGSCAKN